MKKLIVFTASWCQPCQNLKKLLDAKQIPYEARDVEEPEHDKKSDELGVQYLPAAFVVTVEEGKEDVWTEVKARPKDILEALKEA